MAGRAGAYPAWNIETAVIQPSLPRRLVIRHGTTMLQSSDKIIPIPAATNAPMPGKNPLLLESRLKGIQPS